MKTRRLVSVAILVTALIGSAFGRAAKTKAMPVFPELAKKMSVSGVVKVEVVVEPNGVVKSAKALGGHPLLIDAAVNAAQKFRYETAAEETKETIEFRF